MDMPDEIDGEPLSRSWDDLHSEVVTQGQARVRRRRRARQAAAGLAAVVVVTAVGFGVWADDGQPVRTTDTADGPAPRSKDLPPLVFAREYDGSAGGSAIFTVAADGTDLRQL